MNKDPLVSVIITNFNKSKYILKSVKSCLRQSYKKKEIELLKKNILNSSLVIFKECAHNVHLEKVDEFNNKIQEFLNK